MDSTSVKINSCLNCGEGLKGNFCSNCGQSSSVSRITIKETVDHFFSSSFSIEGPFRKTVTALIVNPGLLYRGYISGHRKTYYKPVAFFVLATAIYLIIRGIIGYDPLEGQMGELDERSQNELAIHLKRAAQFMVANINNILFLLVITLAAMFKLFYRKRYNYAEYLSIGFYISGMYILLGIITMMVSNFTDLKLNNLQLVILIIYTFYSAFSLFQSAKFGSIVKYICISLFSLILYTLLGFSLSLAIVYFL